MAGDGYKVDLSALDQVIRKLNGIIGDLGKANGDTKSNTYLPPSSLGASVAGQCTTSGSTSGGRFEEAEALTSAHAEMKDYLESVVDHLESVMDDFGTKTKKAHGAYQDAEADTSNAMHGANQVSTSSSGSGIGSGSSAGSMSGV
ncbi:MULTISPECIES: hypothetical protein [unclassified Streptomyces]|uniref:hypothetical protein n=1 Tax=unclassified Streptomyces TaxID=2593676 RepID=UPI002E19F022|nr:MULTISPECIES: hypothetical protein [unclassified Streptomyces]